MKQLFIVSAMCITVFFAHARYGDGSINSKLTTVTVYRQGAQLTHTATAQLKQGNNQVIVENIANNIDVNSVQVKTAAGVTVLGVEFSGNYLPPAEKTARELMLDDSLEHLQQEVDKININAANTKSLLEVLNENRNIKGTQSGLSVAELAKLMDYYKTKLLELQTTQQQLANQLKKTSALVQKVQAQIAEEQKKNTSTAGRLTLQLSAAVEGNCGLTITYISQNATWAPAYDVRVQNTSSPLTLVYKAKVAQTTGIDWKQVKLSLSTATPAQWGNAPVLNAWFLAYINPVNIINKQLATANTIQPFLVETASGIETKEKIMTGAVSSIQIRGLSSFPASSELMYVVNGEPMSIEEFRKLNPNDIKSINVLKDEAATSIYGARASAGAVVVTLKDGLEDYVSIASTALDLTYNLDVAYDIPTNGKEQTATLQTTAVKAFYQHYAVPKLDKDAYLIAQIPHWDKLNLLPGEASIMLEDTYVGKSFIDPASTSDTLNLTLGRDPRVAIKRSKTVDYSSVKFLGSNKLQKFTYEIVVKNNKTDTANLLVKDQFPLSTNKDIEVTLDDNGGAEVNKELGILNFKLTLDPGESKKLQFTYSIKYPKDKTLNLN